MIGDFAISKSGHDKDKLYVIIAEDAETVTLSDGRLKPLEKPKKKNVRHIQRIKKIPEEIRKECFQKEAFYNEGIKKALKDYCQLKWPADNQED